MVIDFCSSNLSSLFSGLHTQVKSFIGELNWNMDWLMQRHAYLKQGILNPTTNSLVKGVKTIEDLYEDFAQEQGGTLVYGRQHMLDAKQEKRLAAREALEEVEEPELSPKERRKKASSQATSTTPTVDDNKIKGVGFENLIEKTMSSAKSKDHEPSGSMASMTNRRMSMHERAALADEVERGWEI